VREYEVTLVFNAKLEEEPRTQLIERVAGMLTHGEGEDDKPVAHHWGRRTLAYPINRQTEGYYVMYEAKLDPVRLAQMERDILYMDDVLRHLVVRKEA
jgi:small subunit ribosomal protein S6